MTPKGKRLEAAALRDQAQRMLDLADKLDEEAGPDEGAGFGVCPDCGFPYQWEGSRPCSEQGGPF